MLPSGIAIAYSHSFIKDCQCLLPFFQLGLPLPTAIPPSTVGLPLPTAILLSRIAIAYCNLEFQAILPDPNDYLGTGVTTLLMMLVSSALYIAEHGYCYRY